MTNSEKATMFFAIDRDNRLTRLEKAVLKEITSFHINGKECFATNKYIAQAVGSCSGNISHIISQLEEKGYIVRKIIWKGKQVIKRFLKPLLGAVSQYPYCENHKETVRKPSKREQPSETIPKHGTVSPDQEWESVIDAASKVGLKPSFINRHRAYGTEAIRQALSVVEHTNNIKNVYGFFKQALKKRFTRNNGTGTHIVCRNTTKSFIQHAESSLEDTAPGFFAHRFAHLIR